jgi:hypothetical protein
MVADERCPYAHGPLTVSGPLVDGKSGVDKQGREYSRVLVCPICHAYFAVTGIREIVEVQLV